MDKGSYDSIAYALAVGFDKVVTAEGGAVNIVPVAGGMAILFSTLCQTLSDKDKMMVLSHFVDSVLNTFNDHPISDLLLAHDNPISLLLN
jgi:hypothetical protein